jgi:uncharacterized protein (TIGR03083 family)
MTTTTQRCADIEPIGHREAATLARHQYEAMAATLERLVAEDWQRPTDCPGWSVAHVVRHLCGAMHGAARLRENLSQTRAASRSARRDGVQLVDALTAEQVRRWAGTPDADLAASFGSLVDPAVRGRARMPAPVRSLVRIRVRMGSIDERWTLGYLVDTILTRDTFMHRIDVARATGHDLVLDDPADRRLVADIVAEWARRHGQPVTLTLTGPAGGVFVVGDDGASITVDTVEFCRILAGRAAPTHPLLGTEVPF